MDRTKGKADRQNWRLRVIRRGVEAFLKKYYPAELEILPVAWNQFLDAQRKGVKLEELRHEPDAGFATWTLSFAAKRKIELIAPLVILTVFACLEEIEESGSGLKEPSIEEFQAAIRSCSQIFNAPSDLCDQMALALPGRLRTLFIRELRPVEGERQVVPKRRIEVSRGGRVEVDGNCLALTPSAAIVLCELVRTDRLHWLEGFVLLEDWSLRPPINPYGAFRTIISRITAPLRQHGLHKSVVAEKTIGTKLNSGYWRLSFPRGIELGGAVWEARTRVTEAHVLAEAGQHSDALRLCVEVLEMDPANVEAARIMMESRVALEGLNPSSGTVKRCRNVLLLRERLLERAHRIVSKLKLRAEQNIHDFPGHWLSQLCSVRRARVAADAYASSRGILGEEEIIMRELGDLIHALADPARRKTAAQMISKYPLVVDVAKNAAKNCRRLLESCDIAVPEEDIPGTVWKLLNEGGCLMARDVTQYESLSHLKASWVRYLAASARDELVWGSKQLTKSEIRMLSRYRAAFAKIAATGIRPDDASLRRQLGWTEERYRTMQTLLEQLGPPASSELADIEDPAWDFRGKIEIDKA